jgi:hypothetical protein
MKFIIKLFFLFLIIVGISEPVFAMQAAKNRPVYYKEYNYIKDNSCNAVAMIPYEGDVLYQCSSGETFWSDVLVPTEKSPLFMYFKNRKHQDDDDAAANTANSASFSYY